MIEAIGELLPTFTAPGCQVACLMDGTITQAAHGLVGRGRSIPVTAETHFPLGSVTKVFTATLALQLVADRALGLDRPIGPLLPGEPSRSALGDVTLRQLLSHTSGLESDHASGWGAFGSVREYVQACGGDCRVLPPGRLFSYSSGGYVVVAHLVEACTGRPWSEVLRTLLLDPLESPATLFLTESVNPGALADGHVRRPPGEEIERIGRPSLGRAWAPAGGLATSATGLLRLAALHLASGHAPDGLPLLDSALVDEMLGSRVAVPDTSLASEWGLGWAIFRDGWFGHSGMGEGVSAHLRVNPEQGVAIAMVLNCLPGDRQWRRLLAVLRSLGVDVPDPDHPGPAPDAPPIDPEVVGRYANGGARLDIGRCGDAYHLEVGRHERYVLQPLGTDRCVAVPALPEMPAYLVVFIRDADSEVRFVHCGGRAMRRLPG